MFAKVTKYLFRPFGWLPASSCLPQLWMVGLLMGLLSLSACKVTRHLEPGEHLIKKDPGLKTDKKVAVEKLEAGIRVQDNRRMLAPKIFLHLYNTGRSLEKVLRPKEPAITEEEAVKGFGPRVIKFFKYQIGEPPVLLDTFDLRLDSRSLREICFANGYFYPQISYEIDTLRGWFRPKKKVKITYVVREGTPYLIRNVSLSVLDTLDPEAAKLVEKTYQQDTSTLRYGNPYQHIDFARARVKLTQALRDQAFYTFSQDMISFELDTMLAINTPLPEEGPVAAKWLDIRMEISEVPDRYVTREIVVTVKDPGGLDLPESYLRLRASELTQAMRDSLDLPNRRLDSTLQMTFLVAPTILERINCTFIANRIHLKEKEGFFRSPLQTTRQRLQELGMFQYVLINPRIVAKERVIVEIELQLAPKYQVKAGAETFTTDVYLNPNLIPNVGANISFRDKNAFHQSELLQWDIGGSVGWSSLNLGTPDYYQASTEARIQFHKFLFSKPFLFLLPSTIKRRGLHNFSPSTQLSASFRVERTRQQVTQITPGVALSYSWNHIPFKDFAVSRLTPLKLEYINPTVSAASTFLQRVQALPSLLQRDFSRRVSSRMQYSYTQQNYRTTRSHPTYWFRLSVEWGGNMAYLAEQVALWQEWDKNPGDNSLGGVFYGQYIRGGLEGKWFVPTSRRTELVFRALVGVGTPYLQSSILPKEGRFFGGGINGLRAWQSNTVGPGKVGTLGDLGVVDTAFSKLYFNNLLAPGGEYQVEVNAEFRFDLGSIIELALFTDAGNVWLNQRSADLIQAPKASLSKENLALAWDAGMGVRLDLSFLILRLDIGQQLYHPAFQPGWVPGNSTITEVISPRRVNVGIDYPF